MKRGYGIICTLAACVFLTACAQIPDLTDEQEEMVTEYAASLMLKYDSQNHSRLVDTTSYVNAYETAKRIHDDAEARYYAEQKAEEEARREEARLQEELSRAYEEATRPEETSHNDGTGGAKIVDSRSIESLLGCSDFSIQYAGSDTLDSYPEEEGDVYFSLDAKRGNKLLIVYFNVTNLLDEEASLDIFEINPTFKLSVNGGSFSSVYKTFVLEDDLTVFSGSFSANEMKRLVLVTEVSQDTVIESLDMRVSVGVDSLTKSLR